ncbi:MAG: hypothetical protein MUE54_03605 [Anaerolineae bacterium]|nr:hypothetical protein [Anaerolineae bacterium]
MQTHDLSPQLPEADQLIKDLEKERDLSQFIDHFINTYREELAIGFLIIAADLWCEARQHHLLQLEIKELQTIAHRWAALNAEKYLQRTDFQTFLRLFSAAKIT